MRPHSLTPKDSELNRLGGERVPSREIRIEMNDHQRINSEEQLWVLAEPLLQQAGVTRSTMTGSSSLRLDGDLFATIDHHTGNLVIKLNEQRVSVLLENGEALPFAPTRRRFREWASIPHRQQPRWASLLDEAFQRAVNRRTPSPRRPTEPSFPRSRHCQESSVSVRGGRQ